jgi:hypothetical protein
LDFYERSDLNAAPTSSEKICGCEVATFIDLVVMDELGIRPLGPTPRRLIALAVRPRSDNSVVFISIFTGLTVGDHASAPPTAASGSAIGSIGCSNLFASGKLFGRKRVARERNSWNPTTASARAPKGIRTNPAEPAFETHPRKRHGAAAQTRYLAARNVQSG